MYQKQIKTSFHIVIIYAKTSLRRHVLLEINLNYLFQNEVLATFLPLHRKVLSFYFYFNLTIKQDNRGAVLTVKFTICTKSTLKRVDSDE